MYNIKREDLRSEISPKIKFREFLELYNFKYWNDTLVSPARELDRQDSTIIRVCFLNDSDNFEWFQIGIDDYAYSLSDDYLETIFNSEILNAIVSSFCYDERLEQFVVYLC
jgi:hypothetical protein